MSHDALFQLGMGSVGLNATQTEEPFGARAIGARATALCATDRGISPDAAMAAAKALFPATGCATGRA
jgi:hypothetical protein